MELSAIEKGKGKLRVEVRGETHTMLNLIRENSWKAGAKQASYIIQHPYISQPEVIIRSKNPSKTLKDAAQLIIDDSKGFSTAFKRAMKK
jgi:DNA-directed RNA polymerase subunit L